MMGIEPTYAAWEAAVLPLNYTRASGSQNPAERFARISLIDSSVKIGAGVVSWDYTKTEGTVGPTIGGKRLSCQGIEVSLNTEIAELLIDVEAQLRQLGQWDKTAPPPEALASQQPFCIDTLTLPQWLQFIFLPTLYRMLEAGEKLPQRCGIAPMAEEYFRGTGLGSAALEAALVKVDELLNAGPPQSS